MPENQIDPQSYGQLALNGNLQGLVSKGLGQAGGMLPGAAGTYAEQFLSKLGQPQANAQGQAQGQQAQAPKPQSQQPQFIPQQIAGVNIPQIAPQGQQPLVTKNPFIQ